MIIRFAGGVMILLACGAMGFSAASQCKTRVEVVQSFLGMTDNMIAELSYRITPLPELCRRAGEGSDYFRPALYAFANALESQIEPAPMACMEHTLARTGCISREFRLCLLDLAQGLGSYDLQGQLRQLEGLHRKWSQRLSVLREDQPAKARNCRLLGICAGCALAILLV